MTTISPELEKLAQIMDNQFQFLGYRFGLNLIIDLVPWAGDIISTIIALYVFVLALKYNVSKFTMFRMLINIAVFFIVGLIPWVGDLFGVWWKPNIRNINLVRGQLS